MKVYKENLIAVLTQLGIAIPDYITMDQKQITRMIAAIETALDTYDPAPPGNALVTDVLAGKIFSTAAGLGLTGTLTLADLTDDADATDADILDGKTAYVNGALVTGVLQFTPLPTPQSLAMGNLTLVVEGAPWYTGLFDAIEIYDGDSTKLGEAAYAEGSGWTFDLSAYILAAGEYEVNVKYAAAAGTTLGDSPFDTLTLTAFDITRTLTGCEDSNSQVAGLDGLGFGGTLSLLEGFNNLPAAITVEVNALTLTEGIDYTYSAVTGEYSIYGAAVTDDIVITAVATA
jgi:hypothetical protein